MAQIKYPIGIQTFSKIRMGGLKYIDKTKYIYSLVNSSQFVFLSRPRRFGKSLLLSTIKEYFLGRRDLFEGLEISRREHDWVKHPVLHLDFTGANYNDSIGMTSKLNSLLTSWEREYGIEKEDEDFGVRFASIIKGAFDKTGKEVVILIDEYDKPLLETVDNPELQQQHRDTLRGVRQPETHGPIYPLRHADRCHQVRSPQHIQRPKQPQRHIHAEGVRRNLRHNHR